ncbi:MAG: CPBP family intramembrane glutamic endopeptidase [Bacteroidales bacterium]
MNLAEDFTIGRYVCSIIVTVSGYYSYFYITHSANQVRLISLNDKNAGQIFRLFIFEKTVGFIFLGLLPGVVFKLFYTFPFARYAVFGLNSLQWYVLLVVAIVLIIISFNSARRPSVQNRLPQMRLVAWGWKEISVSFLGWASYLLAYEFLFRGILLFSLTMALGVLPAVVINVALYSAFHLPNGKDETLAAIPFGLVLCISALLSGSFIPAFLLHFILAFTVEMSSIHFNPELSFSIKNR